MPYQSRIDHLYSAQPQTARPVAGFCARCGRIAVEAQPCCGWCGYRHGRPLALSRRILAFDAALVAFGFLLSRLLSRIFR